MRSTHCCGRLKAPCEPAAAMLLCRLAGEDVVSPGARPLACSGTAVMTGGAVRRRHKERADLDIVLADWGKTSATWTNPKADRNGDDFVRQADLDTVLADWGKSGYAE